MLNILMYGELDVRPFPKIYQDTKIFIWIYCCDTLPSSRSWDKNDAYYAAEAANESLKSGS